MAEPERPGAERGALLPRGERTVVVTAHPSSVLRLREAAEREAALSALTDDLRLAARGAEPA